MEVCSERLVPNEEDVKEHFQDRELPSFAPRGPSGPVIDPSQAITIVYRYLARYGSSYKPFFTMTSYTIDPLISLDTPVRTSSFVDFLHRTFHFNCWFECNHVFFTQSRINLKFRNLYQCIMGFLMVKKKKK